MAGPTRENEKKRVALVTGASSGIGRALAVRLSAQGWNVAALARREDRLRELEADAAAHGTAIVGMVGDVTDADSLAAATKATVDRWGQVDLVVANAGFAVSGPLHKLTIEDYRRQFETNVFGVLNTVYATKEPLFASKGILAIVGSVAGHVAMPYNTAYGMSKFSVRALAYGLRLEWRKKGVAVVHVSPGFVDTDIVKVANDGTVADEAVKKLPSRLVTPIDRVVPEMLEGILSRRKEVTVTRHGKVMTRFARFFPKTTDQLLMFVK